MAQVQSALGVRFFRRFLCALKEKIVGNDFSRQPRRGEAQGCAEQIGSGASPRLIEASHHESRTKSALRRSQNAHQGNIKRVRLHTQTQFATTRKSVYLYRLR
jgi:hypothetical protein